ncbi:CinA family protein [Nocardia gipuzkoensis]
MGSCGLSVAVAESLTSGRISSILGAAPSSGDWFRGGVVAYSTEVKRLVLGVPDCPPVCRETAEAMATGVRALLRADIAVAVTGAGGPDPQGGEPPGSVWFAVASDSELETVHRQFSGEPHEIVAWTGEYALELLWRACARHRDAISGGMAKT